MQALGIRVGARTPRACPSHPTEARICNPKGKGLILCISTNARRGKVRCHDLEELWMCKAKLPVNRNVPESPNTKWRNDDNREALP
jgi:hypothetical protein